MLHGGWIHRARSNCIYLNRSYPAGKMHAYARYNILSYVHVCLCKRVFCVSATLQFVDRAQSLMHPYLESDETILKSIFCPEEPADTASGGHKST